VKFLWQNIVCRFGLPHTIISDGTNFASKWPVSATSTKSHINFPRSIILKAIASLKSVTAPLDNLCKSLDKAKSKWAEKLLGVLWAYRTTKRVPTGKTPFLLAYGTEAIIPIDVSMLTLRVEGVLQDQNDNLLHLMMDHLEERRHA